MRYVYILFSEDYDMIGAADSLERLHGVAADYLADQDAEPVGDWYQPAFNFGEGAEFWRIDATAADLEPDETFVTDLIAEIVPFFD